MKHSSKGKDQGCQGGKRVNGQGQNGSRMERGRDTETTLKGKAPKAGVGWNLGSREERRKK